MSICILVVKPCYVSEEGTTQGNPLAMPMYALGVVPLINSLSADFVSQVWYADDTTACRCLSDVRHWWDQHVFTGLAYGYFLNPPDSEASLL